MRTILATLLALLLSTVLAEPFSVSTSALFAAPEKRDFQLTDLFAQIADQRPMRMLDDRIVIVNIGRAGRAEVAEGLSLLSLCGPKVVGVDVSFAEPSADDSRLLEALACNPGVVLPVGVSGGENGTFDVTERPFFHDYEGLDVKYGVTNFPARSEKATIREYAVDFKTDEGRMPSFISAIADAASPEAMKKLRRRNRNIGVTSYHSREFNIVDLADIEDNAELFADKIVMVGALDDATDMHSTPVNSYMSGVLVHAHALATVLDGIWFRKTGGNFDIIVAIVACLLITFLSFSIVSKFKGVVLRLVQVTLAYAAVRIGYSAFIDHHLLLNFTHTLLIIAFGLFAVDIWNGVEELTKKIKKKYAKTHSDNTTVPTDPVNG